ncbi:MAG TPA: alpha-amylase family glycosyl hydrolase [Gaiellaceae bacterium]|nr:alpha-amylase family glycosyl hydrolase [Gaiellaceae bacterium]
MRREAMTISERLGAVPLADGGTHVAVWAPTPRRVAVRAHGREHPLRQSEDGVWSGDVPLAPGDEYLLVADGEAWPDPCSRFQPEGVRGPSRVVDTGAFRWSDAGWGGLSLDELVIYELHVGTFSEEGTFDAVVPRLRGLRELGVGAIELMPVATFPGNRGWGYDGLYTYAPHRVYGGPDGLARLVDAAHAEGLGVILDVVYNHVGPGSEALRAFGPYFTHRHETFWGDAIDYAQRGVREWALQNAELWTGDYHVDGLRLDAVHAIFDDSEPHICAELEQRAGDALVISEIEVDDWRPIEEWGHDAQWVDRSHHELHVLLTGERDGYYAEYEGSLESLVEDLRGRGHDPRRLVVCAQNHDQVGNRALGDRLPPDALRLAAAVTLFSPCTPLLFMGEEYLERRPFQFFTDHIDPAIAEATRAGRRREFQEFAAFAGEEVPDPQALSTFLRSKLDPKEPDPLYRELLRLRRELPRELDAEIAGNVLRLRRGDVLLVADFANRAVELVR